MGKRSAIKKFEEIRGKLPNDETVEFYKIELRAAAEKYFTKDSEEYKDVEWAINHKLKTPARGYESKYRDEVINENRAYIDNLIPALINAIKIKGLPPKGNWLKRLPDAWLYAIVFTTIPSIFGLGVIVNDKLTIKREYELQKTIDSLYNILSSTNRPAFGVSDPIPKDSIKSNDKKNN